jgi:hypothetical protein
MAIKIKPEHWTDYIPEISEKQIKPDKIYLPCWETPHEHRKYGLAQFVDSGRGEISFYKLDLGYTTLVQTKKFIELDIEEDEANMLNINPDDWKLPLTKNYPEDGNYCIVSLGQTDTWRGWNIRLATFHRNFDDKGPCFFADSGELYPVEKVEKFIELNFKKD